MHQDPEHEDYDDDEYKYYPDAYSKYDYSSNKFNIDWAAWEKWLSDALKDIVEEKENVWIITNKQEKSKEKYFVYLGSNKYDEAIWKAKYFACNQIDAIYRKHIESHAVHFVQQPQYYKDLHTILN